MMQIVTFRMSVICGSLSRIAVGAMPFLLPMMLQLGFGLSAAQSGLITFVTSIGSLASELIKGSSSPVGIPTSLQPTAVTAGPVPCRP